MAAPGAGAQPSQASVEPTARPRRGVGYTILGVLVALLGLFAIFSPVVTGLAITLVLGVVLVVGAIFHFVAAFSGRGWKGFIFQILLAILYGIAGLSLFSNPIVGLVTLTLLLAAYLFASGIVEIVIGVRVHPASGWWLMVVSGVLSLVLGGMIFVGFPSTAAWALGLLVGVGLLSTGISMVFFGSWWGRESTPPAGRPAGGAGND